LAEFSPDELFACFVSAAAAIGFAFNYYPPIFGAARVGRPARAIRFGLAATPPIGLAILLPVLCRLAARAVVTDGGYVVLFTLAGVAWMWLALVLSAALGVSFYDDAIERRNPAAAIVVAGAMLGVTCAYAGANVGEGASIWMTFGPAVLVTIAWAVAWAGLQWLTDLAESVAVGRDVGAGVRLAAFLVVSGAVLGRAVAGDYHSAGETVRDFARLGWPVLPLIGVAAVVEWIVGRRRLMGGVKG
jgi:hypothetical protein